MNDGSLIKLLKNNPTKGLSSAMNQYGALVKTIIVRIIGYENPQDVEEIVSDVFVELWKSIDNFNSEKGTLKNYLISIARFVGINAYNRKVIKHASVPIEEIDLEIDVDLVNEISKSINKTIIKEAIEDLQNPDRDIFIRRYYLFEPIKEIALSLNLTPKVVENKLYRGKQKLKTVLINKGIIL